MKILLFIDSLVGGGAQRQLVGLAKLLKQRGVQVKVITYHYIPFYLSLLVDSGVDYENIYKARNKCMRLYYIRRAIICYRPDWVIAYLDTPNILACICKLLGGSFKLIVSERNTTQKLTSRERFKFLLYRIAAKIIPNSYSQERFILNNHLSNKEKLKTITNFVDIEYFSPLAQKKDSRDICRIICVGRIAEQKNILRFIQAVQILSKREKKFHVIWYGSGTGGYRQHCEAAVKEYGISNYFEFVDSTKNIRDKYREADVCCLPSIYEGFPNVICEAMSCGLPILCSAVCDNPFIIKHNVNGLLFDPLNVYDIADKLYSFINLPLVEKNKMSLKNREDAISKFSSERFIGQYLILLNVAH